MKKSHVIGIAMVLAVFSLFLQAVSAATPISGAIFTTLEDGTRVNANHYADKRDVYLDGGPGPNAPQDAAGLPDGNYYFQVTDPSGKKLLSEDPVICREFRVDDGVIVEYVSIGRSYEAKGNNVEACYKDGWKYGMHDLGEDVDHDAITIQLMPYKNTPNKGGVYKAWATPVERFDGDPNVVDNGYRPGYFHGFIPKYSKTDNFKVKKGIVKPTPELTLCKFEDLNGNGLWDTDEPGMAGWTFYVTDPLDVTNTYFTEDDGCITLDVSVDGVYIIEEEMPDGWSVTATIVDGSHLTPSETVTIEVDGDESFSYSVTFGNFECFTVDGHKYNDLDGNGEKDTGEPGIQGWGITLYRYVDEVWTEYDFIQTDSNGYYSFEVCEGGEFKVEEDDPDGWSPTSDTHFTFTAMSGVDQGEFNFLNFECFTVDGYKYDDKYGDGDWDEGDTGIEGWTITLNKKVSGNWEYYDETTTDEDGYYSFEVCEGGEFKVVEEIQTGWEATSATEHMFTAESGKSWTYDFFNFKLGKICGTKWYDSDMDASYDSDEDVIEGFKIEMYKDGSLYATTTTDENGWYCFENLGPGNYAVKEVMPNDPGEYWTWANTYPAGDWVFEPLTSGTDVDDADFGNVVEYTGGLTWGYWKTHTGLDSPPRDPAYDLLPSEPMKVDVETPDGDYLVETDSEAKWIFSGAGGGSPSCSGDCRSLFRAQLLALHMNLLKFTGMGDAIYIHSGDPYDGKTVQDIHDAAVEMLTDGQEHDFKSFQETLDRINNNGHEDPGDHVLGMKEPPEPDYGP